MDVKRKRERESDNKVKERSSTHRIYYRVKYVTEEEEEEEEEEDLASVMKC